MEAHEDHEASPASAPDFDSVPVVGGQSLDGALTELLQLRGPRLKRLSEAVLVSVAREMSEGDAGNSPAMVELVTRKHLRLLSAALDGSGPFAPNAPFAELLGVPFSDRSSFEAYGRLQTGLVDRGTNAAFEPSTLREMLLALRLRMICFDWPTISLIFDALHHPCDETALRKRHSRLGEFALADANASGDWKRIDALLKAKKRSFGGTPRWRTVAAAAVAVTVICLAGVFVGRNNAPRPEEARTAIPKTVLPPQVCIPDPLAEREHASRPAPQGTGFQDALKAQAPLSDRIAERGTGTMNSCFGGGLNATCDDPNEHVAYQIDEDSLLDPLDAHKPLNPTVSFVDGDASVSLHATGYPRHLVKGGVVLEGDIIKTKSNAHVELTLLDGSIVRVGASSTLMVNQATFNDFGGKHFSAKLILGRAWAKVAGLLGPDSTFEIETDNAVAGVRGTTFRVDAKSDRSVLVRVYAGAVAVNGTGIPRIDHGRHQVSGPHPVSAGEWERIVGKEMQVAVSASGVPGDARAFTSAEESGDAWVKWNEALDAK